MLTDEEEELWSLVEREGFPMEDTMVAERPEWFHREEDIDTTPEVWSTPPHPRIDAAGHFIPRETVEFRRYVAS